MKPNDWSKILVDGCTDAQIREALAEVRNKLKEKEWIDGMKEPKLIIGEEE